MSDAPSLELSGLAHAYAGLPVFAGVDLEIAAGEFLAVLGASGCGKSTLLRCVAGLVTPSRGTVRLAGTTVARDGRELVPAERRRVGLVFQDYALFPTLSVRENVGFGLEPASAKRVDELLELIGMRELAERAPSRLSGGQQQRVAIARALAPRPRLLMLDEPFANVDAGLRQRLGAELQVLVRREGTSVLLVTHDRSEALAVADRVALMCPRAGAAAIEQCASPEQVYHCPATREAAELVGPAAFVTGEATGASARTELGAIPLAKPAEGPVELVLRPEGVSFEPAEHGSAEVVARLFQGRGYRVVCRTPAGEIVAETGASPRLGSRGRLSFPLPAWALPR